MTFVIVAAILRGQWRDNWGDEMGPLHGLRIIEMKGIGPGPYAGMLLADLGAEVIVVERASRPNGIAIPADRDVHSRGKRSIALDLKQPAGLEVLLRLIDGADGLLEGYRPGVAERLGFGPDVCLARNPRLVFGRLTGWGQNGPLAETAGHDINYLALTGALDAIGPKARPVIPLNLLGDYAGGSLFLVVGMLAALLASRATGKGQVVDAAITDGVAHMMSGFYGWQALGFWHAERQSNLLDGGAAHYNVYETSDGQFMAVGALEPQFYQEFMQRMDLPIEDYADASRGESAKRLKDDLAARFRTRSRDEWTALFYGTDACVAPVLDMNEATVHPHLAGRQIFRERDGVTQPAAAPRFSATPTPEPGAREREGTSTAAVLAAAGFTAEEIASLSHSGVLS